MRLDCVLTFSVQCILTNNFLVKAQKLPYVTKSLYTAAMEAIARCGGRGSLVTTYNFVYFIYPGLTG